MTTRTLTTRFKLCISLLLLTTLCVQGLPSFEQGNSIHRFLRPGNGDTLDTIALALVQAGIAIMPLDETIVRELPRTAPNKRSDPVTEALNSLGDAKTLLAIIGTMYLFGDDYDKQSARTALRAWLVASAITEMVKAAVGRERPGPSHDVLVFHGPSLQSKYMSFPSGHSTAAFSVATVLAERYPEHRWVLYGLATGVAFARVRKSAHFPSDALAGAGIGIYAGNHAVNGR